MKKRPAQPSVGVVVPCYNQGRFLRDCIDSIRKQTFTDWTALLVDDGSDDGLTPGLVDEVSGDGVVVEHLPANRGLSHVRNLGLQRFADREFLLFVDADDWLAPDYLSALLEQLDGDENLAGAFGTQRFVSADGRAIPGASWPVGDPLTQDPYERSFGPGSGTLYRVSALAKTDGWRDEFSELYEDWELNLQLLAQGKLKWVERANYFYRRHSSAILTAWTEADSLRFRSLLLRFHKHGIAQRMGLQAYLARYIVPAFVADLRRGRLASVLSDVADAGRAAPLALFTALARYYALRLAHRSERLRAS